jgi:lycopene cyclase domain-containing protein
LETRYLYLLIDLAALAIPLAVSFHPAINFASKWRYYLPAIFFSALIFIGWDMIFTAMGVWGFNARYVTGLYLFNLPVEEVLFFICIPYACLFTNFAVTQLVKKDHLFPHQELITSCLIVICLIGGIYNMGRMYSAVTFLVTGFFLAYHLLKIRANYTGRFYFSFFILLVPFFVINGILTGSFIDEPVVWYNNEETTQIRIGTIPVEDFMFGLLVMLVPLTLAEKAEYLWPEKRKTLKTQGSSVVMK